MQHRCHTRFRAAAAHCLTLAATPSTLRTCPCRTVPQRGIDLASLDVSYFTSLSYYILLLFGLRGVFSLVFRCVGWGSGAGGELAGLAE